jgi:hypothetical protein
VTVLVGDADPETRTGIDVLVPDDEDAELEALLAEGVAFDGYQVYRAAREGTVFAVVVMEDTETEAAVVYPVYYDAGDRTTLELFRRARREGELRSYLRILTGEYVELTHEDPDLFVPEDAGEGE